MFKFNKKAEGYIDTVITVLLSVVIIYTTITLVTLFITYQKVNTAAEDIAEYAANVGEVSTEDIMNHCALFVEKAGLDKTKVTVSFDGSDTVSGSENDAVQYGDKICVSVSVPYGINLFGESKRESTMTVSKSSLSEKYWK